MAQNCDLIIWEAIFEQFILFEEHNFVWFDLYIRILIHLFLKQDICFNRSIPSLWGGTKTSPPPPPPSTRLKIQLLQFLSSRQFSFKSSSRQLASLFLNHNHMSTAIETPSFVIYMINMYVSIYSRCFQIYMNICI